jgi:hypothetical protein
METIEEVAEKFYSEQSESYENAIEPTFDNSRYLVTGFIDGAKYQSERMYSDMQEYAEFCIECDRKEMPLLLVQDWYEHYKNQNNEQ